MNKDVFFAALAFAMALLAGCQVIGGIFKAGVWVGVLMVVVVIVIIVWIARSVSKK